MPSASRSLMLGSTVISAVSNFFDAAATPSAVAIVVLPTPPVPSRRIVLPLARISVTYSLDRGLTIPRCYRSDLVPRSRERSSLAGSDDGPLLSIVRLRAALRREIYQLLFAIRD